MNFTTLASDEQVATTVAKLSENVFLPEVLATKEQALARIKELIPASASVNNGASRTLEQIGFVTYLKEGTHGWNNLHEQVLTETDQAKQGMLRKQLSVSDYYVGSAHAVTEEGELFFVSATGSQLSGLAFTAQNLILVIGTHKIVPTLADAFTRVKEHIIPLEDENMRQKYGMGTLWAKTLVLHKEHPMMQRSVHVLIVQEPLGF